MKGMNQFAKTHSHALTLLKGSMEKKKANFYVEKGYPSLNHFLDQKHRTPFYGEIEMGVKKIKGKGVQGGATAVREGRSADIPG